jgi:hypothetical protein
MLLNAQVWQFTSASARTRYHEIEEAVKGAGQVGGQVDRQAGCRVI